MISPKTALVFDPRFDPRADAGGKDPDATSATLREYHRRLWSKPLPDGRPFTLHATDDAYLRYEEGGLALSSDSAMPTWTTWKRMKHITEQLPAQQREDFVRVSYQMGGMMLWPSHQVDGEFTINQERGCNPLIVDRFDVTVECVRRYYAGEVSPLAATFQRYDDFFALFGDFTGFVDFWLLQDLVPDDGGVSLFLPWGDGVNPLPQTVAEYEQYREAAEAFIEQRNLRMEGASQ